MLVPYPPLRRHFLSLAGQGCQVAGIRVSSKVLAVGVPKGSCVVPYLVSDNHQQMAKARRTCLRAHIHAYILDMQACNNTRTHINIHVCVGTCIHRLIRIHFYIYIHIPLYTYTF